jgi:hypothetical protein
VAANGKIAQAEAYADAVLERLTDILHAVGTDDVQEQVKYVRDSEVEAGGGIVTMNFTVPTGAVWVIERAVYSGTPAAAVDAYLDEVASMNRIDSGVLAAVTGAYVSNSCDLYIPSGRKLFVQWALQSAGQLCAVVFRLREIQTGAMTQ